MGGHAPGIIREVRSLIATGTATGVTAGAAIADNVIVRGDGGARGVQATGIAVADTSNNVSGMGTLGCGAVTSTGQVKGASGWFGDAATNYAQFAADGEHTMVGSARFYRQDRIYPTSVVVGSSAPTASFIQIGTTATMLTPVLSFSKITQQDVYFIYEVPYDNDDTTTIIPHVHWKPGAGWTAGNYMWKLEYIVMDKTGDHTAGASTIVSADVTPSNATNGIESMFSGNVAADGGQHIHFHLYRDVAADNGDDVARFFFLGLKRTCNRHGNPL